MKVLKIVVIIVMTAMAGLSQNEQDAMRYSRLGVNGSSRFNAMGGAFGAVGADASCAAYNPAGLALFRKSEWSYSANMRIKNNSVTTYDKTLNYSDAQINFNHFGLVATFTSTADKESRTVVAITATQLQNFNNTISIQGNTNNSSIAKDMLNLALQKKTLSNLNSYYEGLAYSTYLLDYDSVNKRFFSFLDTKRTVKQSRDIITKGRQKEFNFSVAHTFKDNFYIGASIGVPVINYTSTTTHVESDDKDSMRVVITSPSNAPVTYSTTYIDGLPSIYTGLLGFSNLSYTEYFRTNGTGINLKIGAIYRVNDMFRLGFNYQSKSYYSLTDVYYNALTTRFDKPGSLPIIDTVPKGKGYYKYKLVTPSRVAISGAFIYKKLAVISLDYEMVNYGKAQLNGANASDFSTVNSIIQTNYSLSQNIRVGAELNVKPMMLRMGYNMQGSTNGDIFAGNYVRNTISFGVGFRSQKNLFFDVAWFKTMSKENYYMFSTLTTKTSLVFNNTSVAATIGYKF